MAQFKPGKSGNPKGRPVGIGQHNEIRKLLLSRRKELVEKAISLALEGDSTALRLCLERISPSLRAQDLPVSIPGFDQAESLVDKGGAIINVMSTGRITVAEASSLISALANQARLVEATELEKRIEKLEECISNRDQ